MRKWRHKEVNTYSREMEDKNLNGQWIPESAFLTLHGK